MLKHDLVTQLSFFGRMTNGGSMLRNISSCFIRMLLGGLCSVLQSELHLCRAQRFFSLGIHLVGSAVSAL